MRFWCVVLAVVGVVSLLSGCRLFQMDVHEQLDKILAEIGGRQIVALRVGELDDVPNTLVSVEWVRDGRLTSTWFDSGELVTEDRDQPFPSSGPVDLDRFGVDALVAEARAVFKEENCTSTRVDARVGPSGKIETRVDCDKKGEPGIRKLHERSKLDGQPAFLPALDFESAPDVEAFKKAYTDYFGAAEIQTFSYGFEGDHSLQIGGLQVTNTLGEPCLARTSIRWDEPSTLFPMFCDDKDFPQDATITFNLDEYDAADIAAAVSGVRNNPNLNQSAMISIDFYQKGNELFWEAGTTDTGDMMKYSDQLSGYVPQKA